MITRLEQKALFDSIVGDLTIDTHPDGVSGDNVVIPVEVNWGLEPKETILPSITMLISTFGRRVLESIGQLIRVREAGDWTGFLAEFILSIKIRTSDHRDANGHFIEKTDIADALYQRVFLQALHFWDDLIEDGSVMFTGISPVSDVSEIIGLEQIKEYQFTVSIQKLVGGIPDESAYEVKFSTAPTLLSVDGVVEII